MDEFQRKILTALIDAGGEMTLDQVAILYERRGQGGDAIKIAGMNRRGLTEYVRNDERTHSATGLRITEFGRKAVS